MTFPISKTPWNQGKLVGQKLPLKLEQIWAIRIRLETTGHARGSSQRDFVPRLRRFQLRDGE